MKKYLSIGMFLPCVAFATVVSYNKLQTHYQALCIKEPNPVKRHHYCYLLDILSRLINNNTSYDDTELA